MTSWPDQLERLAREDPSLSSLRCPPGTTRGQFADLSASLVGNKSCAELVLEGSVGEADSTVPLIDSLHRTGVEVLNLDRNKGNVGDATAQALGEALRREGCRLREIHASHNAIGDKGTEALARGLESNSTVVKMRLQDNEIEHGASKFVDVLRTNATLEHLYLGHNYIHANAAVAMARAMKENAASSITFLYLYENGVCQEPGGDRALEEIETQCEARKKKKAWASAISSDPKSAKCEGSAWESCENTKDLSACDRCAAVSCIDCGRKRECSGCEGLMCSDCLGVGQMCKSCQICRGATGPDEGSVPTSCEPDVCTKCGYVRKAYEDPDEVFKVCRGRYDGSCSVAYCWECQKDDNNAISGCCEECSQCKDLVSCQNCSAWYCRKVCCEKGCKGCEKCKESEFTWIKYCKKCDEGICHDCDHLDLECSCEE